MAKHSDTGAGLARNMAAVIGDTMVKVRTAILPHEQRERIAATSAFMESLEQELAPTLTAMYGKLASMDNLEPGVKAVLDEMMGPQNQSSFLLQLGGFIGGMIALIPSMGAVAAREDVMALNQQTRNIPLSPADAAQAVMRGMITDAEGQGAAGAVGLKVDAFENLVEMTGEPPGAIDMVNLWWQGRITESDLDAGLLFSRLNDRYIPMIKLLAVEPMSGADAVEATIKGVIDQATGEAAFIKAGGMADDWPILYEAAGDAIGVAEAGSLINHGLISQAEYESVIARSRINPIFYGIAQLQRNKWLAPYQIMQILKAGGVDPATATTWLLEDGLPADQAASFVAAGMTPTSTKAKAETEGMVIQEYQDNIITEAEAQSTLVTMGYDANTAGALTALADAKRALSQRTAAVSAVRTAFLNGRITSTQASGDLDALLIPVAARDAWLTDWAIEKTTKTKTFTTAQIGAFAKDGIITYDQAATMWGSLGWAEEDTPLLAAYYGGPAIPGSPASATAG